MVQGKKRRKGGYRSPMRLLPMEAIRAALATGPEWWRAHEIRELFGISWDPLKRTPGLVIPPGRRGVGYHRDVVWSIAQQRQALALAQRSGLPSEPTGRDSVHEWCDPEIIRAMLARWADDHTTIQELHDRAGVRPIVDAPRRRWPRSMAIDDDDSDNDDF